MDLNSCVQILFALVVAILGTPASSSAQGTSTIHVAHPERRDETTITRGLVIRTYPMPAGQGIAKEPQQPSVTIDVKGPLVVGFFHRSLKPKRKQTMGGIAKGSRIFVSQSKIFRSAMRMRPLYSESRSLAPSYSATGDALDGSTFLGTGMAQSD